MTYVMTLERKKYMYLLCEQNSMDAMLNSWLIYCTAEKII